MCWQTRWSVVSLPLFETAVRSHADRAVQTAIGGRVNCRWFRSPANIYSSPPTIPAPGALAPKIAHRGNTAGERTSMRSGTLPRPGQHEDVNRAGRNNPVGFRVGQLERYPRKGHMKI